MSFLQNGTCSQELEVRGEFGPVENAELLVRIVKAPQHIAKKTSQYKPSLFSWSDIRKNGVSLIRDQKITDDDLLKFAQALVRMKAGETLHGLLSAKAQFIRELVLTTGSRALCVLEDPVAGDPNLPDNPAHAVAISSQFIEEEDKLIEIQTKLLTLFSKHETA